METREPAASDSPSPPAEAPTSGQSDVSPASRGRFGLKVPSLSSPIYPFRVLWFALREFVSDGCPHKAAALAFTTILTTVPVLIVSFALFQAFGALKEVEALVQEFIFNHLIAASSQTVSTYLGDFIHKTSAKTVGIVGIVALIGAAFALLNTVEHVLDDIWKSRQTRRVGQRFTTYIAMILVGPILVGVSISITAKFTHTGLYKTLMGYALVGKAVFFITPLAFSWLAFFLIYIFLTGVRLPLGPAAVGAVVGGTLWELAKICFDFYILRLFAYSKIYGSLVAFPIFLLWIYVSWFIILYGAEVAYTIHHFEWLSSPLSRLLVPYPLMEQLAIRCVLKAAEAFDKGKVPVTPMQVAQELGLERGLVEGVLDILTEDDILMRSYSTPNGYFLSRSITTIRVSDVLDAIRVRKKRDEHSLFPYTDAKVQEVFLRMDQAYDEAVADLTLGDLVAEASSSEKAPLEGLPASSPPARPGGDTT
jgi:membrane protein